MVEHIIHCCQLLVLMKHLIIATFPKSIYTHPISQIYLIIITLLCGSDHLTEIPLGCGSQQLVIKRKAKRFLKPHKYHFSFSFSFSLFQNHKYNFTNLLQHTLNTTIYKHPSLAQGLDKKNVRFQLKNLMAYQRTLLLTEKPYSLPKNLMDYQ